jgi:hypothetical protein
MVTRNRKSRLRSNELIRPDEVDAVFDEARVRHLATIAALPSGADINAFGEGIRHAARVYVEQARTPDDNELHDEIKKLYRAAERRQYKAVANCLGELSPRAQDSLTQRAQRISRAGHKSNQEGPRVRVTNRHGQVVTLTSTAAVKITLPAPGDLLDESLRDTACETIMGLCSNGGEFVEGRHRPSGKRSRPVFRPRLYAPEPQRNFSKRGAERNFLILLRIVWIEATGVKPSRTADSRKLGPFAAFVRKCFRLVGATDVNVVELINATHRR